jgi:hypothetical protein
MCIVWCQVEFVHLNNRIYLINFKDKVSWSKAVPHQGWIPTLTPEETNIEDKESHETSASYMMHPRETFNKDMPIVVTYTNITVTS